MDASQIRRQQRLRRKLDKAKWFVWLFVVALVGYYVHWRTELVATARVVSDEFLTRIGKNELNTIRARLLSASLITDLPERKFDRQMSLLARKLGHLQTFNVVDEELSWDNKTVRLIYKTTFSRAEARAIFEIMPNERGIWKLETFFFWADNWQGL